MISLSLKHGASSTTRHELKLIDETEVAQVAQELLGRDFRDDVEDIPRLEARKPRKQQEHSVFHLDPYGAAAEQFRLMQRRLCNLRPAGGVVLFTSPGLGDGKSLNAHNLAWALAEAGHRTFLLDLDLRRPGLGRYLPSHPPKDVTDVLAGEVSSLSATRRLDDLPLFYLGLDKPASRPVRLLRSKKLNELLGWARQTFDWVIIDGPPVLAVADVEELLPKVDLTLMVVRERGTPRAMLERAADRLGDRLSFVIYNDTLLYDTYGPK